MSRRNTLESVLSRLVVVDQGFVTPCRIWTGSKTSAGYGNVGWNGKVVVVHRLLYQELVGPLPDGSKGDHICHTYTDCLGGPTCPHRLCAEVEHIEPVSNLVNCLRGMGPSAINARKLFCDAGHPLFGTNLHLEQTGNGGIGRRCRKCRNLNAAVYRERRRAARMLGST